MELYIVNLLSPKKTDSSSSAPEDFDGVRGRHIDIKLSGGYDQKTDELLTGYVNLIERLISVGDNDELIKEKINGILDESAPRRFNTEEFKKNIDMVKKHL